MAIEGPLRELGIHDVFQLLDLSRKTGVLKINSDVRDNRGTVYFKGGAVIFAEIHSNPHLIGELLIRSGKIAATDLNRAREVQRRGDKRKVGEILVDIGAIVQKELDRQVRRQVEEVVFEMLNWHEGHFSFEEGDVMNVPGEAVTRIPTEALLMEGARRIDEWSRIQRKIPHTGVVPLFAPPSEGGGMLTLRPDEWEILAAVDGSLNVAEIADSVTRSEFDVAKIIFGLESSGVLLVRDESRRRPSQAIQSVPEMVGSIEQAIEEGDLETARGRAEAASSMLPEEAIFHLYLGRIHKLAGRPVESETAFRRSLKIDSTLGAAHRELGDVLAMQGRYAEAVDWWQRWAGVERFRDEEPDEVARVNRAVEAAQNLERLLKGAAVG